MSRKEYLNDLKQVASEFGATVRLFWDGSELYSEEFHGPFDHITGPLDFSRYIARYNKEKPLGERWEKLARITPDGGLVYEDQHSATITEIVRSMQQRGYFCSTPVPITNTLKCRCKS